ncbi:c-type cytochrome [Leptospira idonii]|uniref:Cytochrome c n=1 Tax=Leptospira idonii TaxID=1193500 RepID=A0A4R9M5M7_9LEPT|nr:cytochrome c [Leptospira idonii]TGN20997.1 cytochrome c [Leptospira idonii]
MNFQKLIVSLSVLVFSFAMIACGGDKPTETTTTEVAAPAVDPEIARGEELYLQNACASCHGEKGLGDGEAGKFLKPLPRNYKSPANEWKNGNTLAGITKTLKEGIKNTPMVAYTHLGDENIAILAKYVEHLSKN